MRSVVISAKRRVLLAVLVLLVARNAIAYPLHVEHCVITRQAQADNGTAHVYVRNVSDRPIHIDSVTLSVDGQEDMRSIVEASARLTDDDESGLPYLWWRALPNPIEPNGFADLAVKLLREPTRKLRLRFTGSQGVVLVQQLDRVNDGLSICSVGIVPERDEAFIYVESRLGSPITLKRVFVNGQDVTERAQFIIDKVSPGGKAAIKLRSVKAFDVGSVVFLRVVADPAVEGVALVRAVKGFPVTWIDGTLPEGLKPAPLEREIRPGAVRGEGIAGYENIMRCPAHAHGTRREAAASYIAAHEKSMKSEPRIPGMIYVCRWEKERNYFVFSELGDVVRVMPFAGSASYVEDTLNHPLQWLTGLAVQASAPRPVHAVVPIRFEDSYQWTRSMTPDEVRAMIYLPLSRGVKGLCYGRREEGLSAEAHKELVKVTREIDAIRGYLAFSEPMPWGRADQPLVETATLLAGDRALVVLVVNHAIEGFDNEHVLKCTAQSSVRSEITLPEGLRVASVRDVEQESRPVSWRQEQTKLIVNTDRLIQVRPYLVIFDLAGESTSRPSSR